MLSRFATARNKRFAVAIQAPPPERRPTRWQSGWTEHNSSVAKIAALALDLVAHHFWRLRQQGGVTYWDTSADGVTYFTHASTTYVDSATLSYTIGGGTFNKVAGGGKAILDTALLTGP